MADSNDTALRYLKLTDNGQKTLGTIQNSVYVNTVDNSNDVPPAYDDENIPRVTISEGNDGDDIYEVSSTCII